MTEDIKLCDKKRYETVDDAVSTLLYLESSKKAERGELRYYKCHICYQYHLTSKRS